MASRFGPHGLMSVKCLYAYNVQTNMSEGANTTPAIEKLANLTDWCSEGGCWRSCVDQLIAAHVPGQSPIDGSKQLTSSKPMSLNQKR